jgi:beta-glucosidase
MRTYPEVEALLGRMSLEQKVGQMTQTERLVITADEVKRFHIGSVLSGGGSAPGENLVADWVEMNEAYWQASMSEDEHHIAIPLLYGVDAIHGNNNVKGATVFPHNLGLGAARDIDLMRRIGQVTAKEILASGVEWTFAPTLAVAHDPRWGRTYESYGRDVSLIRDYAYAMVQGLQADLGDDGVRKTLGGRRWNHSRY